MDRFQLPLHEYSDYNKKRKGKMVPIHRIKISHAFQTDRWIDKFSLVLA